VVRVVRVKRNFCRHVWVEVDKRTYDLKCEKCGVYVRQGAMSWPTVSKENFTPTVKPMMVNHQKEIVERDLTRHLTEDLTKHLYM